VELRRDGVVRTRYAFGLVQAPPDFGRVAHIEVLEDALRIADAYGAALRVPFDGSFLA